MARVTTGSAGARAALGRRGASGEQRWLPYLLVLPTVLLGLGLWLYPMLYSIEVSTYNWQFVQGDAGKRFVGLENYSRILFRQADFWNSIRVTLAFVVSAVTLEFLLGLAIALALNLEFAGRRVVRTLVLVPMMITPIAAGLIWKLIYDGQFGVLNYLIGLLGIPPRVWLGDPLLALGAVVLVDIWHGTPFVALVLLAGLQTIPPDYYEAASIDGAGFWGRLRYITLPLLAPVMLVVLLFRTITAIRAFDVVYALTQGGPAGMTEVIGLYLYKYGFRLFNIGYAAALSIVLAVFALLLCLVYLRALWRRRATAD